MSLTDLFAEGNALETALESMAEATAIVVAADCTDPTGIVSVDGPVPIHNVRSLKSLRSLFSARKSVLKGHTEYRAGQSRVNIMHFPDSSEVYSPWAPERNRT